MRPVKFAYAVLALLLTLSIQSCANASDPLKTCTYTEKEIHCSRDGMDIYGIAYIPEDGIQKKPLVIMSHGYGGNVDNCKAYADTLAQKGYAVYRFDFNGGGRRSKSQGKSTEMSIFSEQADLEAVLDAAKGWDFVDSKNIFLMGESQGGMVSAMTGAARGKDVKAMMLLYPALCIADDAVKNYGRVENVPETISFMNLEIGLAYYKELFTFDTYKSISGYSGDVLIIHGDKDGLVPYSYSEKALEVYKNAELIPIPGANHGFRGTDQTLAKGYLTDFMLNHASNN